MRRGASVLLAAMVLAVQLGSAAGQEDRVTVRLDGRAVIRVGPTADASAAERAARIENRLELLLENPSAITAPRVEPSGEDNGERAISVAGVTVVTVTMADAEENLVELDELASQWAEAINVALTSARDARVTPWGRFASEVVGTVRATFGRLGESTIVVVPRVLAALLLIGFFWLLATGVRVLLRLIFARVIDDLTVENLIKQVAF